MDINSGYWFKSTLFDIEPGEDEETNPGMYGRQLAQWIRNKLLSLGYDVEEVIPEDWGWCVVCQRDPYMLFIACVSFIDYETDRPDDPPPIKEEIKWHVSAVAEKPFFKSIFKKIDTSPGLDKLDSELRAILENESEIEFIDEP